MTDNVTILYRPVGPKELKLIEASDYREFPPRLPEQPIFYPVLNEEYAAEIARDWNAGNPSIGCWLCRLASLLRTAICRSLQCKKLGSEIHQEYWIPAEELADFNANIVGKIEVIREFHAK